MQNLIAKKWNSKNKNSKDTTPIKKNKLIIYATAWIDKSQNAEHRKSDTTGQFWTIYIYMKFRKCQNEWKWSRSAHWLLWGYNILEERIETPGGLLVHMDNIYSICWPGLPIYAGKHSSSYRIRNWGFVYFTVFKLYSNTNVKKIMNWSFFLVFT